MASRDCKAIRSDFKESGLPFLEIVNLYSTNLVVCPDDQVKHLFPKNSALKPPLLSVLGNRSAMLKGKRWPLYETVNALSYGKIGWLSVLKSLVEEKLRVAVRQGAGPLIRRLEVNDIDEIQELVSAASYEAWTDEVILTNAEAGFYLGVASFEISRLVTSGLLASNGLKLTSIKEFNEKFICAAEISTSLEIHGHPIKARAVNFAAISGAGIPPIHSRPSIRPRCAVEGYFNQLGYLRKNSTLHS